jgi:hypothetical protein
MQHHEIKLRLYMQETRSNRKKHLKLIKANNMKKIFLSLGIVMMMGMMMGVTAFANGDDGIVSQQARNSFKKDFSAASKVSWELKDGFVKATFYLNNQVLYAYYNTGGDLQAIVRNILSDQLPISLVTGLRRDYADYWITDLFEISANGQTTYYVTVENSDRKIVLKSEGTSDWDVFSKEKKVLEQ